MILHYLFSIFLESLINQNRFIRFCINSASPLLKLKNIRAGKISLIISTVLKEGKLYKLYFSCFEILRARLFFLQRYIEFFNGFTHLPDSIIKNMNKNISHNVQLSKVGI